MDDAPKAVWILGGCERSRARVCADLTSGAALLGHTQYVVVCALDGAEAARASADQPPSCVLRLTEGDHEAAGVTGSSDAERFAGVDTFVLTLRARDAHAVGVERVRSGALRADDMPPVALASMVASAVASAALRGQLARRECELDERTRDASLAREDLERTLEDLHKLQAELALAHREAEVELTRNPVSGLPSRAQLLQQLESALAAARRYGHTLAVLYLDVDDFGYVNERVGHSLADRVLREVAGRVGASTRASDLVAHVSGNAFAVLLARIGSASGAGVVARKVQAAVAERIHIEAEPLALTCSIGIAVYPGDADDGDMLLSRAHTAMCASKRTARGGLAFFDAAINERMNRELALEGCLRESLREGQLSLVYQPQLDLCDGRLVGAEALLRWQHPKLGWQRPDVFIPVAERSDLIVDIGDWVVRHALAQRVAWDAAGVPSFPVSVNVSVRQLRRPDFADRVATHVFDAGLSPESLRLEITETSAMTDPSIVRDQLERLRSFGIGVSLDDFGVGYSSLSALESLPVDTLKLDRTFIHDVHRNAKHEAVAAAVIALARGFACDTVAEGVETECELERIRELGYAKAQGFLLARPLTPAAFDAWLSERAAGDTD
jgi:diguanylate cyclase (GGDEF)-like protein